MSTQSVESLAQRVVAGRQGAGLQQSHQAPGLRVTVARGLAGGIRDGGQVLSGVGERNGAAETIGNLVGTSVGWIKITSGQGVSGSGVVSYTVASGEGKPHSGSISILTTAGGSPIKGKAPVVVTQTK